jgi:hypothetical protein
VSGAQAKTCELIEKVPIGEKSRDSGVKVKRAPLAVESSLIQRCTVSEDIGIIGKY